MRLAAFDLHHPVVARGPCDGRLLEALVVLEIASSLVFTDSYTSFNVHAEPSSVLPAVNTGDPVVSLLDIRQVSVTDLRVVAGVDIGFLPSPVPDETLGSRDEPGTTAVHQQQGVATVSLLSYPSMKVLHVFSRRITLSEPYIPSYLAFREAPHLLALMDALRVELRALAKEDAWWPQLLLVDGNGRLHVRECGLACVLGLKLGIPTIGVSKKPYVLSAIDGCTSRTGEETAGPKSWMVSQRSITTTCRRLFHQSGSWIGFPSPSKKAVIGAALVSSSGSSTPIFVSPGHLVSLETSLALVLACSRHRIPEPVRIADLEGREEVRRWVAEREKRGYHSSERSPDT